MTREVDFIDEWGFPTANTLYGNFPLLCPQWLVWAEPHNPQRLPFPCQLPVFHGPFAFQAAFAHTMQGDCRGRAPSWNWWFFHICFSMFHRCEGWFGTWNFRYLSMNNLLTKCYASYWEISEVLFFDLGFSMAGGDPSDLHTDVWSWFTAKQRFPHLLQQTWMDSWTSETQRIAGDHHLSQFRLPAITKLRLLEPTAIWMSTLAWEVKFIWIEASFDLVFWGSMLLFGGVSITFELSCNMYLRWLGRSRGHLILRIWYRLTAPAEKNVC